MSSSTTKAFAFASIFSSHAVLQRNKPVCIFGTGTDGKEVTVTLYVPAFTSESTLELEPTTSFAELCHT